MKLFVPCVAFFVGDDPQQHRQAGLQEGNCLHGCTDCTYSYKDGLYMNVIHPGPPLNSATFRSHTCRKDHRLGRKSCFVSTITLTHPPWIWEATLPSLGTSVDERESDRPLPCDDFIGHPHAPFTVQTALSADFQPLLGVIAHHITQGNGSFSATSVTVPTPHTRPPTARCFMRSFFEPYRITATRMQTSSKAKRHRQIPSQTRNAKLFTATHPRPRGNQHHLQGLLSTFTAGQLPVIMETAKGRKLLGQSLASRVPPSHPGAHR